MAAVVVSLSNDEESFLFHAINMIKYMFWHGMLSELFNFSFSQGIRTQECFFKKQGEHLSLDLVRASEEEGFGKPAPLLAILGLPLGDSKD